jgi:hypothetical protein
VDGGGPTSGDRYPAQPNERGVDRQSRRGLRVLRGIADLINEEKINHVDARRSFGITTRRNA